MNDMEINRIEHSCMRCQARFTLDEQNCVDGMNCPICGGPIRITGFETETLIVDGEPIKEPALLTIELESETSVPKVFYKGEEITDKVSVSFDWETDTDVMGGLSYAIEHREKGSYPVSNRIERRVKGHSF